MNQSCYGLRGFKCRLLILNPKMLFQAGIYATRILITIYPEWIEMGLHFAVTHAELDYRQSARFDDELEITTWLEFVRGASLAMGYTIVCESNLLVTGRTEHASINEDGRVRRIPKPDRERLGRSSLPTTPR